MRVCTAGAQAIMSLTPGPKLMITNVDAYLIVGGKWRPAKPIRLVLAGCSAMTAE